MLGLAGLVGVEPVRGVAWESRFGTAQHVEMTSTLAYLVVDKMEKVCVLGSGMGTALSRPTHTSTHMHAHTCICTHMHAQLSTSEDSVVWSLSVWLAGQVAVDVAEMLAQRERGEGGDCSAST